MLDESGKASIRSYIQAGASWFTMDFGYLVFSDEVRGFKVKTESLVQKCVPLAISYCEQMFS
jgi:hypothetical protein